MAVGSELKNNFQNGRKRTFDGLKFLKWHPVLDTGAHKLVLAIAGQPAMTGAHLFGEGTRAKSIKSHF